MDTPFSMYQVGSEALLPPRDISVSQWADENVVLAGAAAAERGQWQTRPYQREPMDVLSPSHPCKLVVLMAAAQTLKTSILVNFLGYIADVDPGPVLVVEPRSEDAKALSKDRVAPMFRNTPCLRGKLAAVKSRDSNNTALHKVFTNGSGHITFTGAISPKTKPEEDAPNPNDGMLRAIQQGSRLERKDKPGIPCAPLFTGSGDAATEVLLFFPRGERTRSKWRIS